MDDENFQVIDQACPAEFKHKVAYLLDYASQLNTREVPDPYYGGAYGFDRVLDMVEAASAGFLKNLQQAGVVS